MYESIWALFLAAADAVEAYFTTEWDVAKVLQSIAACVTILGGTVGVMQTWRFAEKRLGDRLTSFLKREDERLNDARQALLPTFKKERPSRRSFQPVFSDRELSAALRQLKWGRTKKANDELTRALKLIDEKVGVAEERVSSHRRQKATAHLLLGAIADANKEHLKAYDHFQRAVALNENDVEAIEYAGQQLLRIPDAALALDYFARLLQQATLRQDVLLAARSKVYQARAYYALPTPNTHRANQALVGVTAGFPPSMPTIERATIYELHGDIRRDADYGNAHGSYMQALTHYSQAKEDNRKNRADAEEGMKRVTTKITKLNEVDSDAEKASPNGEMGGGAEIFGRSLAASSAMPPKLPEPSV